MGNIVKIKQKLALIIILSSYIILKLVVPSNAANGTISSSSIRLRKEPSTSSEILETILKNEKVEIISEEDGWYKAKYKNLIGYLSKEYVKVDETVDNTPTSEPEPKDEPTTPTSTEPTPDEIPQKSNFNKQLHILPLINSTVIYEIKEEDSLNTIQEINNWKYVEINGTRGWANIQQNNNNEPNSNNENNDNNQNNLSNNSVDTNTIGNNEIDTNTSNNTVNSNNTATQQTSTQPEETTKEAYISVEQVNFRKEASMEAVVIDTLSQNTKVEIIGTKGEWSKIKYKNEEGYIATRYLSDKKVEVTTRSSEPRTTTIQEDSTKTTNTTSSSNSKKEELIAYAKQFLGCKYVSGGTSPSGFDCSGFTYYVYKHFGYTLSRASSAQVNNGTTVAKSDLQIGDLVFFSHYKTFKGIGHVGIYIGNNQFIHASSSTTGVIISSLDSGNYPKRYVTAKRIF